MSGARELFEGSQGIGRKAQTELTNWLSQRLIHGSTITFPASLASDDRPRTLFLSIANTLGLQAVVTGSGRGIQAATHFALNRLDTLGIRTRPVLLKVDIVRKVQPFVLPPQATLHWPARSRHGMAIGSPEHALLAEEIVARRLITASGHVRRNAIYNYLAKRHPIDRVRDRYPRSTSLPAWRFTTDGSCTDGQQTAFLYRGHPMEHGLGGEQLLTSARLAGRYLTSVLNQQGRFSYRYQPDLDRHLTGYNILRHAGTTWAMLDLYQQIHDPWLMRAAERAIAYLLTTIQPCRHFGVELPCVIERGQVKLGGQGLALICLARHAQLANTGQHLTLMRGIAEWIVRSQNRDGEFACHKIACGSTTPARMVSGYYPGEAILGLLRLHAIDQDARWLEAAHKGAQWLIGVKDLGKEDVQLEHNHWLLYALNELHRLRPSALYLAYTRKLAAVIIDTQHRQARIVDWRGGWYKPPRTTPTATRAEGLAAAYQLLRDHDGSAAELATIREAIETALCFQLDNQYTQLGAMYLPNPGQALGGFRGAHEQAEIRIDYVQHSISALLLYLRLIA